MTQPPPPPPHLTPQYCFHPRLLRDFLRLSRSQIDDTISTHLNALLTPSTSRPFDPESTSTPSKRTTREPISAPSCQQFVRKVLYPTWSTRDSVIRYCSAVAASPDPNDPDLVQREHDNLKAVQRIVDERLDPYSARYFPREARTEQLAALLRNEESVERIVRGRVWGVVAERCDEIGAEDDKAWEKGLKAWQEREGWGR